VLTNNKTGLGIVNNGTDQQFLDASGIYPLTKKWTLGSGA